MGEVAQAGGAEDQAESEGAQRDDQGQDHAVQDELENAVDSDAGEDAAAATTRVATFAYGYDGEEGLLVALEHVDRALRAALHFNADRQRGDVDRGRVLASGRDLDGRLALGVGLRRARETVWAGDGDRYARNGCFVGTGDDGRDRGAFRLGWSKSHEDGREEAH